MMNLLLRPSGSPVLRTIATCGRRWLTTQGMVPPLKDVTIVDLTRVLAGPYATMLLADLGADVIKIEHPVTGDETRLWMPPLVEPQAADGRPPESAYFLTCNKNKKSAGVDIKTAEGQKIIRDLVRKADVFVENFIPGKLKEYGLDVASLQKENPRLIYASVTGYGQSGPNSILPGYDVNVEAEAGLMSITGESGRPPVKVGVAITDMVTGLYAHGAILAALRARDQTNEGAWIDCNLFDSQVASLANVASNYLVAGIDGQRYGTGHPSVVPYQVFPTKDSYIMLSGNNERQFGALTRALGRGELADDPRFATNAVRVKHRESLVEIISHELSRHTTAEWLEHLDATARGTFPYAAVNSIKETFEHPHTKARGNVAEVDHPRVGKIRVLAPAVVYNGQRMPIERPPPVLGEHTRHILRDYLDYTEAYIDTLADGGIINKI